MAHKPDNWFIQNTHNTARFFTENRHISWMVLVATVVWGIFGYFKMPQRKDPDIPVRVAVAICSWPGVATEKVEQLVTRKIEEKMAENITVKRIESTTRVGVSFVYVTLQDNFDDPGKQFDDIKLELDDLQKSLPEDAPLSATRETAERVEAITRHVIDEYGKAHAEDDRPLDILESLTTFAGGGPRFWFSVSPEPRQTNYAQIIVQLKDKHATHHLVEPLQAAFSAEIAGARVNMRQLETSAVGIPVSIRLSGENIPTLRAEAEKMKNIFRALPLADRVQDNWGAQSFVVNLEVDPDRANLAGVTNLDVASLVGVIVSHVIVLFDFIEEAHERGESLIESLLDASIMRLRPVMIIVGATVFALFPLAAHGGPLWEPLCYAQIGALTVATFITLLLVSVLYAIFVLDLKIVKWERKDEHHE